jgi:CubicO group peptidase (beta-lactamase class C family)
MRRRSLALRPFIGALAFALAAVQALAAAPMAQAPSQTRLDARVESEHAGGRFDGVVLVGRGEAVTYQRAIGWADRAQKQPHRVDEVWRWASVSKQVTALLVMQQVEAGRLTLDTTLDKLLPAFASPQAAGIHVRQLLQHTTGLPNPNDTLPASAPTDTTPPYYTARFDDDAGPVRAGLAYCAGKPLAPPGGRFAYNNCDTLVLQAVLEKLTGMPYARLLAQAVAAPLKLETLALFPADGVDRAQTPVGYLDAERPEPFFNAASLGAGGALQGTARELWQLDRALMTYRLLGEAATRTMWAGDPKLGYVALGAWGFPARLAGCTGPVALVERRGQVGGVQVRNLLAPALGMALVVFSNTAQTEFGEIWQGKGLTFDLASAAFCAGT